RDPQEVQAKLKAVAGDKYSYHQMDEYTDMIEKTLKTIPQVSKVSRSGLLKENVFLLYSQERLASYNIQPGTLEDAMKGRNISTSGGQVNVEGKNVTLEPGGEFKSEAEIGNVQVRASNGALVYVRDLVDVVRGYESPARFQNFFNWKDSNGNWQRSRAITLSVQMRSGEQIAEFGKQIDSTLDNLKQQMPADLIYARTSDQPLQVEESIDLFMKSLYEAIILVVVIALIGFWEWRSALLMALSIPITLAMTFGMAHLVGIDLQQVSIATLIIALGLLVDDPVVANDAIKRELAGGAPRIHAAWLGPTKLAHAILYATGTNIIAYLPFLMLNGSTGDFLRSLPIVMTAALISSRLVSMTFIPLLGYYLLRPRKRPEPTIEQRRQGGFYGFYYRLAGTAIRFRWAVLALSVVFLASGGLVATHLKSQFFPEDVQYWSYVDVWLPNSAPLTLTNETALKAEQIILRVTSEFERQHPVKNESKSASGHLLKSITTFAGGGGPRF